MQEMLDELKAHIEAGTFSNLVPDRHENMTLYTLHYFADEANEEGVIISKGKSKVYVL
ncbi:hypothetical protein NVP1238A_26 [Vibrio phage 1.238.A._10N.261.52.F10]|uniref:Uncharacterized protein n=1 Tax=Vibrio phage 1.238.A._10N.261.52.F10 TaxID=1881231 RepID=A0A2I7RUD8_9CAUD|nr:hypothetical protein KNT79_gp26 [Vibrio phage 1.238.A._10N.261.52.F10]AUR97275.1 hypothetical protein NVP1238A_26 [Vibrio phage 1.238.A._10N.261.52.F10]AUR97369.1 hypothetical protein NVP1238B_27 [Vibrio phage 1.238.B._10N.261.52.F10]